MTLRENPGDGEVPPPWREFPGNDPTWGGWRQGSSEAWLVDVWLPFWRALSPRERDEYLRQWPPPDEEWRRYLTQRWV
jgi:hypothetical protein